MIWTKKMMNKIYINNIMNTITIENYCIFFIPRFEEELSLRDIYCYRDHEDEYQYTFNKIEDKIIAKQILKDLKYEFRYDIEIHRLENILNECIYRGYYNSREESQELISKMLYNRLGQDKKIRKRIDDSRVFILDFEEISYEDFMYKNEKLHRKIDKVMDRIILEIIQSDDYKISKINLLDKILKEHNILV